MKTDDTQKRATPITPETLGKAVTDHFVETGKPAFVDDLAARMNQSAGTLRSRLITTPVQGCEQDLRVKPMAGRLRQRRSPCWLPGAMRVRQQLLEEREGGQP